MAIRLKYRAPDGTTRMWNLKEIVQGKPLGHPSHPLFVHFPIAYYTATLVFDIMSRISPSPALVLAGTYLLVGALLATVFLVITGLVDWASMVRGSSKRRLATRHLLFQVAAAIPFQLTLVLRWSERSSGQADTLWIVLEAIGYVLLVVGQYLGGVLVYEKGMRVSTGGSGMGDVTLAE
jgi:uncharacterized membrane protein